VKASNLHISFWIAILAFLFSTQSTIGQTGESKSKEFSGFSGMTYPAKRTSRGASVLMEDLEAFSNGSIKKFDFQNQYKKVFLGSDFFDIASKIKSCDSLRRKIGKFKSQFVPVTDGQFFKQAHFNKVEELSGYYQFRNRKNLPGILPNVDVWIKMETYKHGKSSDKNCLVIKFLIPEDVNGKIENKSYVMRNDGILESIEPGSEPDFSLKMDFARYCIFPLNDPNETTHLVGKDFNIIGSFATQKYCENMSGLLFPTARKGASNGCVFFRKISEESAPNF
jgi:hypothetical protein